MPQYKYIGYKYIGNVINGNIVVIKPDQDAGKIFSSLFPGKQSMAQPNPPIDLTPYEGTTIEFEVVTVQSTRSPYTGWETIHLTPTPAKVMEAIRKFAPEIHLFPDEEYRPSSVSWYLSRVRMRRHRDVIPDVQILNRGEVNIISLISQQNDGQHSGTGRERTNFFLEIDDADKDITKRGNFNPGSPPECYVHFRRAPALPTESSWQYDIQNWFFYPYNGNITDVFDTNIVHLAHEGDWEHITVRVSENLQRVIKIFFASHTKESIWLNEGSFEYNSTGHPIAYSARHSHATYATPGEHDRGPILPNDNTAERGPIWKTWKNVALIGTVDKPYAGQEWIKYTGRWGERGLPIIGNVLVTHGPYGPAFQPWWEDDDKMNQ